MQVKTTANTITLFTDHNLHIEAASGALYLFLPEVEQVAGKLLFQLFPGVAPGVLEEVRQHFQNHPASPRHLNLQIGVNGHSRQFAWQVQSRPDQQGLTWIGNELAPLGKVVHGGFDAAIRNLISEALIEMDAVFGIIAMNGKAETLLGLPAANAKGSSLPAVLSRLQAVEGIAEAFTQAAQTGSWQGEFSFTGAAGSPAFVSASITRVQQNGGGLLGYIALLQDITGDKMAAEERSRREASHCVLASIMDQSGAISWATDISGKKHYLNSKLKQMAGLPDSCETAHLDEIFDPATAKQFQEENEWVIRDGHSFSKVEMSPVSTGKPVWYRTLKFPVHTHMGVMAAGFAYDVTHEYEQEQELAYLKQRFEIAASITADIITDWDIENDILWRNDPTTEIPVHAVKSKSMQERFGRLHPEDKKDFIYSLNQALLSNASKWEYEYRYKLGKSEGKYKLLNEKGIILRNSEGEAVRMVSVVRDVTEKRRLQSEIREKEQQVIAATIEGQENERNELARELHDNVGQVLAMCKLFVDITADSVQHEYLGKCREHLEKAIREIRSLSHRLSPAVLDRKGLPGALAELVDNINQTGKLSIQLTIASNLSDTCLNKTVNMAAYRIVQEAISNILRHAEATKAFIRLELAGNKLECRVTDNGKGFDPKNIKPGIGLRNIQNRAEYIGGTLHLHSAPGKGCTLEVVLPLKEPGKA